jgi:DNA-binding MarR family transcriptional regulator
MPKDPAMDLTDRELLKEIGRTCACFNLRRAARLVTQRFDRVLRQSGLKATQFPILMAAYQQEGILLTRMAKMLGMERTTLTRNLTLLEQRGMLLVEPGQDRRERQIRITHRGVTLLETCLPLWRKAQSEIMEAVGREKWDAMLSGLHEVARKL